MEIERKVLEFVRRHGLIQKGNRVLAALSGGPDSTFMTVVLHRLCGEIGFELAAAYFDHRIREREKIAVEMELSAKLARELDIPFFSGSGDVPAESKAKGVGIEEAARTMRMEYLERQADTWGADKVALGHTEDDQVETILHHIIRGTGIRGLTGIPVSRNRYIRPILCCRRSEVVSFLESEGIPYAIDETNRDNSITRNRIRNILIPLLRREFNPNIESSILRLSANSLEALRHAEASLEKITIEGKKDGAVILKMEELKRLNDFELYLLMDSIFRERFSVFQDIESAHYDAARRLMRKSTSGRTIRMPFGVEVSKEHDLIIIKRRGNTPPLPQTVSIPGPGRFDLETWKLVLDIERIPAASASKPGVNRACFSRITFPIRIRRRKSGDRVRLAGLRGSKKLSDIFIDRKVGLSKRDRIPVFEDREGIFWVPGVAVDSRVEVGGGKGNVFRITIYDAQG